MRYTVTNYRPWLSFCQKKVERKRQNKFSYHKLVGNSWAATDDGRRNEPKSAIKRNNFLTPLEQHHILAPRRLSGLTSDMSTNPNNPDDDDVVASSSDTRGLLPKDDDHRAEDGGSNSRNRDAIQCSREIHVTEAIFSQYNL